MTMIILRIALIVCFVAFLKNVPFFWMFRIRRHEKKYQKQLDRLENDAMENAVRGNIEKRKEK